LQEPLTVPRDRVRVVRHLTRFSATAWWKRAPSVTARDAPRGGASRHGAVDYVMGWTEEGAALVAIERSGASGGGATRICGWFD
jgi:hypothetical protein